MPIRPRVVNGKVVYEKNDRNWFRLRKAVVQRLREGWSQAEVARVYGVSKGFVSKWWNRWLEYKCWDALRDQPPVPKTIYRKKIFYAAAVIVTRLAHPEMGPQKLKAFLKIDLSHQAIYEILLEAGLLQPGPKVRKKYKSFARYHSNSMWQIDIKEIGD
ncbi:MAG: helix-turn-helix domain-containing protein, partial [Thermoplasmata archaeon]|nr:helix-turn-helix domain-containing protein [Thermoplasmata archaeon]